MNLPAALNDVEKAVGVLRNGGVIAMPTDTLYALSAAARDATAVRRVFAIKGRGKGKAMPLFVSGLAMAEQAGVFTDTASRLAERFWPGPLTIVVVRQPDFDSKALAGSATVALRVPDHPVAQAVVESLGEPVTATSANRSGAPDPVSADDVRHGLGNDIDLLIDGGACPVGLPSTIVDCTRPEPRLLRKGAVSEAEISDALSR